MALRTIAVGAASDPGKGRVDLVLMPGDTEPPAREGLNIVAARDLPDALFLLRHVFANHKEICTLGGAEVIGTDPAWTVPIEARLREFIEDLGNCPIDSWEGAYNAIRNGDRLASGSTSNNLINALKGYPAICIGAGPSATPEVLENVRRLIKTHYVFAADSMLGACKRAGFTPHFVTMIERPQTMRAFVDGLGKGSTLIAPAVVDPACAAEFDSVCWWWAGDPLYTWLSPDIVPISCGRSAGTLSVSAALTAGCSRIWLVGHDLAYSHGRKGHCAGAHEYAVKMQVTDDAKPDGGNYNLAQFQVPGYCNGPVWTNGLWNLFRGDIETMVASCQGSEVFSGAEKFEGAEIAGVSLRNLPSTGVGLPEVFPVALGNSGVANPRHRARSIIKDLTRLVAASNGALAAIQDHTCPLDVLAQELVVTKLVSPENAWLFHYVLRAITSSLTLRMHLHAEGHPDPDSLTRQSISIFAGTLPPLCARIAADLGKA